MAIQDSVLTIYDSLMKRVHRWLLPLLVFFLLGSAYGKTDPTMLSYFSWIELAAVHFFSGWLLSLVLILFIYDFLFQWVSSRSETADHSPGDPIRSSISNRLMILVNTIFYLFFILVCLSGLIQYGLKNAWWQLFSYHPVEIRLAHITIGWLFISSAMVKYCLTVTKWLESLIRYLREN
ncbi:MAG: hypothetical protein ABIK68_11585 [bacterium]